MNETKAEIAEERKLYEQTLMKVYNTLDGYLDEKEDDEDGRLESLLKEVADVLNFELEEDEDEEGEDEDEEEVG